MQNHSETQPTRHDAYIRRHSHDVRNCLAAMDLQIILLERTASKPGENSHLVKVRSLIVCLEELQLRLGLRFRIPTPASIFLSSLFEQCQAHQRVRSSAKDVGWTLDGDDCCFQADAKAVSIIIVEIADHFFSLAGGTITAFAGEGNACFKMQRSADNESADRPSGMDAEVNDELTAIVARFGGALNCGPDGRCLAVTFPQSSIGGSHTAEA